TRRRRARPRTPARAPPRTRPPSGPWSAGPTRAPTRPRRAPPRRDPGTLGGYGRPCPVPRDRPFEALVEIDLRLPAEQLAGLLDVRNPELHVGVVQRLRDDLARTAGQPLDPLREVENRHRRPRVPDVQAMADGLGPLEAEQQRLDHVVDVAPGADLRAVAVDDQVAAGEGGLDERPNRPAADLAGSVDVERAHGDGRHAQ